MIAEAPAIGTTMTVEVIDPERARQYLANAAINRESRQGKIDQYARDMTAGRWYSSVLRFATDGKLVDGQHRLWAVISSGTEQVFYVERGLPFEAIYTIDSGLGRTTSDVLTIRGEINARVLAAAVRYARWFELAPGVTPSSQSRAPFSADEMLTYLTANPTIRESVQIGMSVNKAVPYRSSGLAAALHYLEHRRNPDKAEQFWSQMITGLGLVERTGPYLLREMIIAAPLRRPDESLGTNMLAALSIKAWNAWEAGREVRQLRWMRGATISEAFPRIGGEIA